MFKTFRKNKKGFSLVELIIVIAIVTILVAFLVPSFITSVEDSHAKKDNANMESVVKSVKLALSDYEMYKAVSAYATTIPTGYEVDKKGSPGKWSSETAENGITITFYSTNKKNTTKATLSMANAIVNKGLESPQGELQITNIFLSTMIGGESGSLYQKLTNMIGDSITLDSQAYKNSNYTIFIIFGEDMDASYIYGQWNGTNLKESVGLGDDDVVVTPPVTGDHTHDFIVVSNTATCTTPGTTTSKCSCGETRTESSSALGHNYSSVVTAPTCTEQGYTTHTCSRCGDSYVDSYVDALGHNYEWIIDTPATQTNTGIKHEECANCGDKRNENTAIDKVTCTHSGMTNTAAKSATCTEAGNSAYWYCSNCGKYFSDNAGQNEIAANSWFIAALGHSYNTTPTWSWTGYTKAVATFKCTRSGCTHTSTATASGSAITNGVTTAATCTTNGVRTYTATVTFNSKTYTNTKTEIIAASHNLPVYKGFTIGHCQNSGCSYVKGDVNGDGTICDCDQRLVLDMYLEKIDCTPEADLDGNGLISVLEPQAFREYLDAIEDIELEIDGSYVLHAKPIYNNGYKEYTIGKCKYNSCNYIFGDFDGDGIICLYDLGLLAEKIGLDYEGGYDAVYDLNNDGVVDIYDYEGLVDYVNDNSPTYKSIETVAPTCTEAGYTVYKCMSCTHNHTTNDDYVDALGHTYSSTTSNGYTTYTCSVCSYVYGTFEITRNNREDIGYTDETTDLIIPKTIEKDGITYDVVAIGANAFGQTAITSVTIPNSVTTIGDQAFYRCLALESVDIPGSVKTIGKKAFKECYRLELVEICIGTTTIGDLVFDLCSSLETVLISDTVTTIGDSVFKGCNSLTSIVVNDNNNYYCDVNGVLFNKNKTNLIAYPAAKTGASYTIPSSVTSISNYAFTYSILETIIIPNSVTNIGQYAFSYCHNLETITIPNGVTSINKGMFYDSDALISVVIPDSVTSIGDYAFYNCRALTTMTFNGTKAQWDAVTKGTSWVNTNTGDYTLYLILPAGSYDIKGDYVIETTKPYVFNFSVNGTSYTHLELGAPGTYYFEIGAWDPNRDGEPDDIGACTIVVSDAQIVPDALCTWLSENATYQSN